MVLKQSLQETPRSIKEDGGSLAQKTNDKNLSIQLNQIGQAYGTISPSNESSFSIKNVKNISIPSVSHLGSSAKIKKPLSVWDKLTEHDAQLYQIEQERRRLQKIENQKQMRDFLKKQINGRMQND